MSDKKRTDDDPFLDASEYAGVRSLDVVDLGDDPPAKTSPESKDNEAPGPEERPDPSGSERPRLLRWRLAGGQSPWDLKFRVHLRLPEEPPAPSKDGSL